MNLKNIFNNLNWKKTSIYITESILLVILLFLILESIVLWISTKQIITWSYLVFAQPILIIFLSIMFLKYRDRLDFLNIKKLTDEDFNYLITGLLLTFSIYALLAILFIFIMPIEDIGEHTAADSVMDNIVISILLIVLIGPLSEEIIFRGVIQNHLEEPLGAKLSIIITSILFSIIHINVITGTELLTKMPLITITFGVSIAFGYMYWKSRNLLIPILLHMMFNLTMIIGLYMDEILKIEEKLINLI